MSPRCTHVLPPFIDFVFGSSRACFHPMDQNGANILCTYLKGLPVGVHNAFGRRLTGCVGVRGRHASLFVESLKDSNTQCYHLNTTNIDRHATQQSSPLRENNLPVLPVHPPPRHPISRFQVVAPGHSRDWLLMTGRAVHCLP